MTAPGNERLEGAEGLAIGQRVRIAAWNAAKGAGASDQLGYAVVEAVAAEFADLATPERVEIPAGMKPWHGGDSAPADWDGGVLLLRNGDWDNGQAGNDWRHTNPAVEDADSDIIAYTPATPAEQPTPLPITERGASGIAVPAAMRAGPSARQFSSKAFSHQSNIAGEVERYLASRFEWAAPGDQQEDAWLVRFCDKDCGEAIFTGPDAEREAWEHWNRYAPSYNVYVFRLARLHQPQNSHTAAEVMRLREALRQIASTGYEGAPDIMMRRIARAALGEDA